MDYPRGLRVNSPEKLNSGVRTTELATATPVASTAVGTVKVHCCCDGGKLSIMYI